MSLSILEKGFRLLSHYLDILNKRKNIDEKILKDSFNGLIKMCEDESFVKQASQLKSLLTIIIKQKEIKKKDIEMFNQIWASID